MDKKKEEKCKQAIAKLIEYHVGDRVIITSKHTGGTLRPDGEHGVYDVDCKDCFGKTGTIRRMVNCVQQSNGEYYWEDISLNGKPMAYRIVMDDDNLPSWTYTADNFRRI